MKRNYVSAEEVLSLLKKEESLHQQRISQLFSDVKKLNTKILAVSHSKTDLENEVRQLTLEKLYLKKENAELRQESNPEISKETAKLRQEVENLKRICSSHQELINSFMEEKSKKSIYTMAEESENWNHEHSYSIFFKPDAFGDSWSEGLLGDTKSNISRKVNEFNSPRYNAYSLHRRRVFGRLRK